MHDEDDGSHFAQVSEECFETFPDFRLRQSLARVPKAEGLVKCQRMSIDPQFWLTLRLSGSCNRFL